MTRDEESVFAEAFELSDPRERAAFLDRACAADPALRRAVDGLLAAYPAGSFLESPPEVPVDPAATAAFRPAETPGEGPGDAVGPYKLLEVIGEGGFGMVFVAEQHEPLRRKVAVKVLKPGMDTRQVVARFEAERQALALMDHPHIARVLDGGTTDRGRPYFVMELVRGLPVTEYCDQARLPVAGRLRLFADVCRAVQHAHQKGVIHRDIKPSNVLVTVVDGRPVPKVIDFGVAKAVGASLTDRTLVTGFRQMVGTPLYMAPEQAEMSGVDVDKGVPFLERAVELRRRALGGDHADTLIAMNSLGVCYRDAGRSDKSVALLEETLALYKAKFGPDHPGTITCMYNLADGYRAAGRLDKSLPLQEAFDLVRAKFGPDHPDTLNGMIKLAEDDLSAGRFDRSVALLESALALSRAKLGPDHPGTLRCMYYLARGYDKLGRFDESLPLQEENYNLHKAKLGPDHPATLHCMNNLALGYLHTRRPERALPLLEEALALRKAKLGPDHPDTLQGMHNLAAGYHSIGWHDRAVPLFDEALALTRAKLGPEHPDTLSTMNYLALGYQSAGRLDKSLPLYEEALALHKSKLGPEHPDTLTCMANLGTAYRDDGQLVKAETLLRECLAVREKTQPDDWRTFDTQSKLGAAVLSQKRYAEAESLLLKGYEGMKAREKSIPERDSRLSRALDRLIELYTATGKPDEAAKWRAERKKYPPHRAPPPRPKT